MLLQTGMDEYPPPAGVTVTLPGEVEDAYDFFCDAGYNTRDFGAVANTPEAKRHLEVIDRLSAQQTFWQSVENSELPF